MHVAITGSMGSGKSEVIDILKSFKLPVLSADEIVSSLYETDFIKEEMVKLFGSSALTCMNEIDRKYISFRIFNNSREKERLEALIPNYAKVKNGTLVSKNIGIDKIIAECPHFASWVKEIKEKCE